MTNEPRNANAWHLPVLIAVIGVLCGTAVFYGLTMDVAAALILGAPIGLLAGIIAYRAVPRIRQDNQRRPRPSDDVTPPPTIEKQARPSFKMKSRG